jgi:ferredoxin-NADP reductase
VSTAAPTRGFQSTLRSRQEVAERTFAFHFEKPSGWMFEAGQSVDLTLIDPSETDAEGNTRAYSIASSPNEETLMIATRMRDGLACVLHRWASRNGQWVTRHAQPDGRR